MNWELTDVQAELRKGRRTRDQIAYIRRIIEKARVLDWVAIPSPWEKKNIYFYFIDYTKAFDCGSQQTVENSSEDGNEYQTTLPVS